MHRGNVDRRCCMPASACARSSGLDTLRHLATAGPHAVDGVCAVNVKEAKSMQRRGDKIFPVGSAGHLPVPGSVLMQPFCGSGRRRWCCLTR